MVGAGAALAGASGGEATVAAALSPLARGLAAAAPEINSGALTAGLLARTSVSAPLRLPNTTTLQAVPYFARNF
jgi:hypothetical protein